jgi:hypothetical protein
MAGISREVAPGYPYPVTQPDVRPVANFQDGEDRQAYMQLLVWTV